METLLHIFSGVMTSWKEICAGIVKYSHYCIVSLLDLAVHGMGARRAGRGNKGVAMAAIQATWNQLAPRLARQTRVWSHSVTDPETIPRRSSTLGIVAGGLSHQFPHAVFWDLSVPPVE